MKSLKTLAIFLCCYQSMPAAANLPCNTSVCGDEFNLIASSCKAEKIRQCYNLPDYSDTVTLRVNDVSKGILQLSVDDYPRVAVSSDLIGKEVDISHMFGKGTNNLRMEAFRLQASAYSIDFDILRNGVVVLSVECSDTSCPTSNAALSSSSPSHDIVYDQIQQISLTGAPDKRKVSAQGLVLGSSEDSSIYLNDQYTGDSFEETPEYWLPPGEYRFGVGVSSTTYTPRTESGITRDMRAYDGQYYESTIQMANVAQLLDFSGSAPLAATSTVKVGIVPIRNTTLQDGSTVQLSDAVIDRFEQAMQRTVDAVIEPLSYGLQTWEIDVLPIYDSEPATTLDGNYIDAIAFLDKANLDYLSNQYDVILSIYESPSTSAGASGGYVQIPSGWLAANPTIPLSSGGSEETPFNVMYHEVLHVYEEALRLRGFLPAGNGFIDGEPRYGYQEQSSTGRWYSEGWIAPYNDFFQGKVLELNSMDSTNLQMLPDPDTQNGEDYRFIGVFPLVRNGLPNIHSFEGTQRVRNMWWWEKEVLSQVGSEPTTETLPTDTQESVWKIEKVPDVNAYWIRNAANLNEFLRVDHTNKKLLITDNADPSFVSAQWVFDMSGGRSWNIINRWTGDYLHLSNDTIELAVTNYNEDSGVLDWWSAKWWIDPPAGFSDSLVSSTSSCGQVAGNIVNNCSFAGSSGSGWRFYTNSGGSGSVSYSGSQLKISVTSPGSELWSVQTVTSISTVNSDYVLTFKARADSSRNMMVSLLHEGGNWQNYGQVLIPLTTDMQTYTVRFTNVPADSQARLDFNAGLNGTSAVYIDEISLVAAN